MTNETEHSSPGENTGSDNGRSMDSAHSAGPSSPHSLDGLFHAARWESQSSLVDHADLRVLLGDPIMQRVPLHQHIAQSVRDILFGTPLKIGATLMTSTGLLAVGIIAGHTLFFSPTPSPSLVANATPQHPASLTAIGDSLRRAVDSNAAPEVTTTTVNNIAALVTKPSSSASARPMPPLPLPPDARVQTPTTVTDSLKPIELSPDQLARLGVELSPDGSISYYQKRDDDNVTRVRFGSPDQSFITVGKKGPESASTTVSDVAPRLVTSPNGSRKIFSFAASGQGANMLVSSTVSSNSDSSRGDFHKMRSINRQTIVNSDSPDAGITINSGLADGPGAPPIPPGLLIPQNSFRSISVMVRTNDTSSERTVTIPPMGLSFADPFSDSSLHELIRSRPETRKLFRFFSHGGTLPEAFVKFDTSSDGLPGMGDVQQNLKFAVNEAIGDSGKPHVFKRMRIVNVDSNVSSIQFNLDSMMHSIHIPNIDSIMKTVHMPNVDSIIKASMPNIDSIMSSVKMELNFDTTAHGKHFRLNLDRNDGSHDSKGIHRHIIREESNLDIKAFSDKAFPALSRLITNSPGHLSNITMLFNPKRMSNLIPVRVRNTSNADKPNELIFWYDSIPELTNLLPSKSQIASVQSTAKHIAVSVYPNPTNGPATLHYELKNAERAEFSIHNLLGQKMMDAGTTHGATGDLDLNLSSLDAGVYLLISTTNTGDKNVERIVVTK